MSTLRLLLKSSIFDLYASACHGENPLLSLSVSCADPNFLKYWDGHSKHGKPAASLEALAMWLSPPLTTS